MSIQVQFYLNNKKVHWVEIPDVKQAGPIVFAQLTELSRVHDEPVEEFQQTWHPQQN